jgi:hypothetical protein
LEIPEDVRDLIEFRFFNPQDPKGGPPKHLVGVKKPEKFPTPDSVLQKVSAAREDSLRRWYKEYRFFRDFTHCGMGKLELIHLFDPSSRFSSADKEEFYAKEVQNAAAVSYVATASACTELLGVLGSGEMDRIVKLGELWDFLLLRFLLAKAMWGLRAQRLLPPVLTS